MFLLPDDYLPECSDCSAGGSREGKWKRNEQGRVYECLDGTSVAIAHKVARPGIAWNETPVPRSCIQCMRSSGDCGLSFRYIASRSEFNRAMTRIVKGSEDAATFTLPRTTRAVSGSAFAETLSLRSVILNEGLEVLESCAFQCSRLEGLRVLATVRETQASAFNSCANLRRVEFGEGSALLKIGAWCFRNSGIEDVTLPATLEKTCRRAFMT